MKVSAASISLFLILNDLYCPLEYHNTLFYTVAQLIVCMVDCTLNGNQKSIPKYLYGI